MKKKLFILFAVCCLTITTFSQHNNRNVSKECVLIECFTGISCQYCPGNAAAVSQMLAEELNIAPVSYHTSAYSPATYYTTETNARATYYGVSSYPTSKFDGILTQVGGAAYPGNTYNSMITYYNQRVGISSPFTIDLSYSHISGTANHEVVCTVNKVGTNSSTNLRILITLTQSNIQQSWSGMTTLNNVVRDMIPTQTGTVYSGDVQTVTEVFSVGSYPQEDCWLTAWIQDFSTKEVFQAVRLSMDAPDYPNDIMLKSITDLVNNSCSGVQSPTITVKNTGIFDISSFDLVAKIDGVEYNRYSWNGEAFAYGTTKDISIPEFVIPAFDVATEVEFVVENPNGYDDQNLAGNSITKTINTSLSSNNFIKIIMLTDSKPEESLLEVINMNTNEVIKSITFPEANKTYTEYIYFPEISCYQVALYDTGGDGIQKMMGVFDNNDQLIFNTGASVNQFTYKVAVEIQTDIVNINEISSDNVLVAPNPSYNGIFQISTGIEHSYKMDVYDLSGKKVYENSGFSDGTLTLNLLEKGIYLIKISSENQFIYRKIVIL